ncbi:uncharacterized protein LOC127011544 [Drosophila biarmipes]|uniref:uncharacterized protein LOC127011544 n=1 Tax=Drosophila biarmipes TaxID=125945 RepID=UPI0021CCC649|nr:uncharacterized protein LOC127011544 [Drosophila biarmipes]
MAYPSRSLGDILEGVKQDPKHLRNLSNIYKLELDLRRREYGQREDVAHSRVLLREGPDILASFKKDAASLGYFNVIVPSTFYDVPAPLQNQADTDICDLSTYLVVPDNPDLKSASTDKM